MGTFKTIIRERQDRGRGLFWLKKRTVLVGEKQKKKGSLVLGCAGILWGGLGFILAARCSLKSLEEGTCENNCVF